MSGISRCNFLKRTVSLLELFSVYITKSDHLSQSLAKMFRIGQLGNTASSMVVLFVMFCIPICFTKLSNCLLAGGKLFLHRCFHKSCCRKKSGLKDTKHKGGKCAVFRIFQLHL